VDGRVIGTYVHGLFDNEVFRESLLETLARRRGIAPPATSTPADRYAHLATWFHEALDVPSLIRAVGLAPRV
jgi:adenosylcobyric acid synthase